MVVPGVGDYHKFSLAHIEGQVILCGPAANDVNIILEGHKVVSIL